MDDSAKDDPANRFPTSFPDSLLRYGPRRAPIRVLPVNLPRWHVPTSVVTLKNRTLSPVAQLFIDCLHELAGSLEKSHVSARSQL